LPLYKELPKTPSMGTFKYHMTLQGERFAQTVRVPSYGGGGLVKSSYNFYNAQKA